MICCLGDLVEDLAIRVEDPLNVASDTDAVVDRRRGGSAANVAVAVSGLGHPARFVGQVGSDAIGRALVAELAAAGVDTSFVRFSGRTGTIVVLVDAAGERTMLTDRGASASFTGVDPAWLDGVETLHVPMYSLIDEPLATTARAAVGGAHDRGIAVSVDVSSVALIGSVGARRVIELLIELRPDVVFANADEADALGFGGSAPGVIAGAVTVVKRGQSPVRVVAVDSVAEVPAEPIDDVSDTTGAGDAFAAGFLTGPWRDDVAAACHAGHAAAADLIRSRSVPFGA